MTTSTCLGRVMRPFPLQRPAPHSLLVLTRDRQHPLSAHLRGPSGAGLGGRRRMASVQGAAAPTCSFSLLPSPLPFFLLLSPNPLTSQFPGAGRPPEEGQPAAGSRCWVVARQLLAAVLLLGLSLGSPVLLVYLLRSCGPGKQGPGARSALP